MLTIILLHMYAETVVNTDQNVRLMCVCVCKRFSHAVLCVIRVLQEDVWDDRLDWQGWILHSIEAARKCGVARVFTPDAPEYRSNESAYVKLHVAHVEQRQF